MKLDHHANRVRACTVVQAMSQATQHMLGSVWASGGGARDVYADYNELTLSITTTALFGVDMTSSQSAGISGKLYISPMHESYSWTLFMNQLYVTHMQRLTTHAVYNSMMASKLVS